MSSATSNSKCPRVVSYARRGKRRRIVEAINSGEPVNSVDSEWRSALFQAALHGHKGCVKELLRRGGDPNQKSLSGLTPCHAVALGGSTPTYHDEVVSTRNPIRGAWLLTIGLYNVVKYYTHDRRKYCRCLEYLTAHGGDLQVQSHSRETVRDIAIRMRKMQIIEFIEDFYDVQITQSGHNIKRGQSMLRPHSSYPLSCPRWMHAVNESNASLENISPLCSQASLYCGRVHNAYDYGFVYPFGGRLNPGATNNVPEVMPLHLCKSPHQHGLAADGSVIGRGVWQQVPVTYRSLRQQEQLLTVDQMLREMDALAVLRHPNFPLLMAVSCGPTRSNIFALLEHMHWTPLYAMLHQQSPHKLASIRVGLISGVASALSYLHSMHQVAHCLVSSHSVLLTHTCQPKLINVYCMTTEGVNIGKLSQYKVHLPWMAPELLETRVANTLCDVYSLGVLMWEVWGGELPWAGIPLAEVYRLVVRASDRLRPTELHSEVTPLLALCFRPPTSRPSVTKIIEGITELKQTN